MAGMSMRVRLISIVVLFVVLASCAADSNAQDEAPESVDAVMCIAPAGVSTHELVMADGTVRTYRLLVPAASADVVSVVLDFHGAGSTAEQQAKVSGFEDLAKTEGFVVVTPQGIDNRWSARDVEFVDLLLDAVPDRACVDPDRVFAAGMSNGGFFSARLACDLSERVDAIGTVTGISFPSGCQPTQAVPIVHFHGIDDTIVRFDAIPDAIESWSSEYECKTETTTTLTDVIELRSSRECISGAAIDFYVIDDAGHTWPGSAETIRFKSVLGETNMQIDATQIAWEWFTTHGS